MLPPTIPLFPLPNVVLFPDVCLPLHIFEPRYREMTSDALDGDRIIGMVLLRPGWEGNYDGRPPVYDVGCAGLITHAEKLDDGRYNLVLRGMEKFRVLREDADRSYRRAEVQAGGGGDGIRRGESEHPRHVANGKCGHRFMLGGAREVAASWLSGWHRPCNIIASLRKKSHAGNKQMTRFVIGDAILAPCRHPPNAKRCCSSRASSCSV